MTRLVLLSLVVAACAFDEGARRAEPEGPLEGVVRRRESACGSGFRLAVGSTPVANRRFSLRAGETSAGPERFRVVTSDEGAFRAALVKGTYCFVDVTLSDDGPCAAVLRYDPALEPVPLVFLTPEPCSR